MAVTLNLQDYGISEETGFLIISSDIALPAMYEPWKELAINIKRLLLDKQLRARVDEMELLDHTELQNERHYFVAHMMLSAIGMGYVWQEGDQGAVKVLPRQIAVPWWGVSQYLGLPAIVTHSDYCLTNVYKINEDGPMEIDNFAIHIKNIGDEAYEWFFLVTAMVELAAVPGINACVDITRAIASHDTQLVIQALHALTASIKDMQTQLKRMHERCPSDIFYNTIRQFLAGWGTEGSPLPDGLVFEGVSSDPVQSNGASAAQSSTFQVFDVILGVEHSGSSGEFLLKMRNYMPEKHRNFITKLTTLPKLSDYVKDTGDERLTSAHTDCITALTQLRTYHIGVVTKYVVIPANKERREKGDYEGHLATKGTGGSDVLGFLKTVRDSTKTSVDS